MVRDDGPVGPDGVLVATRGGLESRRSRSSWCSCAVTGRARPTRAATPTAHGRARRARAQPAALDAVARTAGHDRPRRPHATPPTAQHPRPPGPPRMRLDTPPPRPLAPARRLPQRLDRDPSARRRDLTPSAENLSKHARRPPPAKRVPRCAPLGRRRSASRLPEPASCSSRTRRSTRSTGTAACCGTWFEAAPT